MASGTQGAGGRPFGEVRDIRIIGRISVAFLLDMVIIGRGGGDPIDTLLASAIIQANIADITHRAELQEAYIGTDEMPTDEMRRPVSVNAIAASLNMPFETVRRRVNALLREGYCRAVDGGVIVPTEVLAAPKYLAGAFQGYERLRAFYYELRDFGVLKELPEPTVELSANNFPVRTVSRLIGAYVLRVVETMGQHGDMVDGMLLLAIFRDNIEHVPKDRAGSVDDAERRPITASALATRIGMPSETVRRRVSGLVSRGTCERVGRGVIVPYRVLNQPQAMGAIAGSAGNVQRLFSTLSRLGVLKVWDDLNPPLEVAEAV